MKKIVSIIGARPQFIKHSPVQNELMKYFNEITIHTGQHYDDRMSDIFFRQMKIKSPDYNLEIGSHSHAVMTGLMMVKLENLLIKIDPSMVVIYGDTNSTLAGALTASKLHIPVSHIEAGLRSRNMQMPEEINRIVADHISNYLFAPTKDALSNLKSEGLNGFLSGDVMYDAYKLFDKMSDMIELDEIIIGLKKDKYILLTIHREENTVERNLKKIMDNLFLCDFPAVFPAHPRTMKILNKIYKIKRNMINNVYIIEPQGYIENMALLKNSYGVVTDSGGLQKEAYFAKIKCVTLRKETEWVETLDSSANTLCPFGNCKIMEILSDRERIKYSSLYGNGKSSIKIVKTIKESL